MARTERIRQKDLRQPDEFVTLSRRAVLWSEENRTVLLAVVGGVVVLLAAIIAYRALQANRNASAAAAYREAHALLADEKHADAATAFAQAAERYDGTGYGALAQLEAGNAHLLAGATEQAVTAYRKFLDDGPPTDDLRQLALTRLGTAHEQRSAFGEAESAYAEAAELQGAYTEEALLGAARSAEASGNTSGARARYEAVLERFPTSDRRPIVTARLVALGWTPKVDDAADAAAASAGVPDGAAAPVDGGAIEAGDAPAGNAPAGNPPGEAAAPAD